MPLTANQIKEQILGMTDTEKEKFVKDLYGNPDDLTLEGKKVLAIVKGLPVEQEPAPDLSGGIKVGILIQNAAPENLPSTFIFQKAGFEDLQIENLGAFLTNPDFSEEELVIEVFTTEEYDSNFWRIRLNSNTYNASDEGVNLIEIYNLGVKIGEIRIVKNSA